MNKHTFKITEHPTDYPDKKREYRVEHTNDAGIEMPTDFLLIGIPQPIEGPYPSETGAVLCIFDYILQYGIENEDIILSNGKKY